MEPQVTSFLAQVVRWAIQQQQIDSVALVGSHARGIARADSDVDLVLLASTPLSYVNDSRWIKTFGTILRQNIECYEPVQSLRVHYASGLEIEFGFAPLMWATTEPLDAGTAQVVSGGMQILVDKSG